jgi:hypothetical protein
MNSDVHSLTEKRTAILQQMQSIDRLRRGSLSKQFFTSASGHPKTKRGPYYVLQGFFRGKKFSRRIAAGQAAQVQRDVHNYQRFQKLAEDYITLSDQITQLEDCPSESKKNSSPRRSRRSVSGKPKPS